MNKLLIIEDDTIFGETLNLYFTEEGYDVQHAKTAAQGLEALSDFEPDIILLDLVLPDTEHTDPCDMLRAATASPFIVISTKSHVSERIQALSSGADDYLCKPFSLHELKARMESVLRRTRQDKPEAGQDKKPHARPVLETLPIKETMASASPPQTEQARREFRIDLDKRQLYVGDENIETTYSEFEIMKLFLGHPGKVYTRDELINLLHGIDAYMNERAIDVHITNLRKKVEQNPKKPHYIKTVWGVGYKFIP